MKIRLLQREEIPLVWQIDRREIVENIYYLRDGELILKPDYFDSQGWPAGEAEQYTPILLDSYKRGGTFWGAFEDNVLIGVAILESKLIGAERDTLQLKFLHVSRDYRKQGLGSRLFNIAVKKAKALGAKKLYISATPSENTVNYYLRLGRVLAGEIDRSRLILFPSISKLDFYLVRLYSDGNQSIGSPWHASYRSDRQSHHEPLRSKKATGSQHMLYTFTIVANFIALAVALWLGIYIVTRSPRSAIAWLAGLALLSIAGFFFNVLLALNPPPSLALLPLWMRPLLWFWPESAFNRGWGNWLQGWQITPAVMIWHHVTVLIRSGRMNFWRWIRVIMGYAIAIAAIIGQRYSTLVFTTSSGDPLYLSALVPGPLYPLYMVAIFVFIFLSLVNLIRSARSAPKLVQRKQLHLMVTATLIAGLVGPISFLSYSVDFLLPRVINTLLLGCAVFMIGYGVARYSALIEGRIIGRDFVYNGVVVLSIATIYMLVVWSSVVIYGVPVAALAIVLILAILTHSLVDIGRRVFDFLFYGQESREVRAGLRSLAQRAYRAEALEENLSTALETLCRFVHATYGLIILFKDDDLHLAASYRWRNRLPDLPVSALTSDDVVRLSTGRFMPPLEDAALLVPLYAADQQQGVMILGSPENAVTYASTDVEQLLDASDRIADLIRDVRKESEHLTHLAQMAQTPPPKIDPDGEIPVRTVEEALRNIYDYAYLSDSPLAALKKVQTVTLTLGNTHLDRGKVVYQAILDALEKMRPPGDVPREPVPRQWYPYLILYKAYLENKTNNEIMMRLYISEGTFNRTRRAAIRSLARTLTEMEAQS